MNGKIFENIKILRINLISLDSVLIWVAETYYESQKRPFETIFYSLVKRSIVNSHCKQR